MEYLDINFLLIIMEDKLSFVCL